MPFIKAQFIDSLQQRVLIDLFVSIFIIFALSFIPASFIGNILFKIFDRMLLYRRGTIISDGIYKRILFFVVV